MMAGEVKTKPQYTGPDHLVCDVVRPDKRLSKFESDFHILYVLPTRSDV